MDITLLNDLLTLLCRTISSRRIYFANHPKVIEYTKDFLNKLNQFFQESNQKELFVGIIGEDFIYEGRRLAGPSVIGKQFFLLAKFLHCGGLTFTQKLSYPEMIKFLDVTADVQEKTKDIDQARKLLLDNGIKAIRLAQSYEENADDALAENKINWQGKDIASFLDSPGLVYQHIFDMVNTTHGQIAVDQNIDMDNARAVSEFMLQFLHSHFADMMHQTLYPNFDNYTINHSVRVAALAVHTGIKFGWKEKDLLDVGTAALMHDIGKSKISNDILYKHGKLTPEERRLMEHHCRMGAEILLSQENTNSMDIAAAWGHHCRYDGGGYPEQPEWVIRHPITGLLHICDVFEALTAVRPYKAAMTPLQAFSIMLNDKGSFHPGLLAAFMSVVGLYPPGTFVKLTDNSTATVVEVGKTIDKPKVKVVKNSFGMDLTTSNETYIIDLGSSRTSNIQVKELLLEYIEKN